MERADRTRTVAPQNRSDEERTTLREARLSISDQRPEAVAQRARSDAVHHSPRMALQRVLIADFDNSARSLNQRQQLFSLFGGGVQPAAGPAHEGHIQRDAGDSGSNAKPIGQRKLVQLRRIAKDEVKPKIIKGDTDEELDGTGIIASLQKRLGVPMTGTMDDPTIAALHRFQDKHQLDRGDVVDEAAWLRLGSDTEHPVADDDGSPTIVDEKSQSGALTTLKQRNAQMLSQESGKLAPAARRFLRSMNEGLGQDTKDFLLAQSTDALHRFLAQLQRAALERPKQLRLFTPKFVELNFSSLVSLGEQLPLMLTGPENLPNPSLVEGAPGEYTANVTEELIVAHRADYEGSASYLQESEGSILADKLDVTAKVFDQPHPNEYIIRDNGICYGSGVKKGILLFVNGNHYVVLEQIDRDAKIFDFIDLDKNKYIKSFTTRSDGHCLIDGLFFIAEKRKAAEDDIKNSRRLISEKMDGEDMRHILEAAIIDLVHGEFPQGLGPNVMRLIRKDAKLEEIFIKAAQEKHDREDRSKSGGQAAVIGQKGVSFAGPTRRGADKEVIHRGVAETEMHDGKPYIRLYLTVVCGAKLEKTKEGGFQSDYKDVQQDFETGEILVSAGNNSMLWVSGGTPLRSIKWAAKYIVQHKIEAQEHWESATEHAQLASTSASKATQYEEASPATDIDQLMQKLLRNHAKYHEDERAKESEQYLFKKDLTEPLIRSYLFPLEEFNRLTESAILETEINEEKPDKKLAEGPVVDLLGSSEKKDANSASTRSQRYLAVMAEFEQLARALESKSEDVKPLVADVRALATDLAKIVVKKKDKVDKGGKVDKDAKGPVPEPESNPYLAMEQSGLMAKLVEFMKVLGEQLEELLKVPEKKEKEVGKVVDLESNKNKTFNVDRHADANQYGFKGKELEALRKNVKAKSLITYVNHPHKLAKEMRKMSGDVRPMSELRLRLGVPEQELNESLFVSGKEFIDRTAGQGMADRLNMYYVTWRQSLEKRGDDEPDRSDPLLTDWPEARHKPFKTRRIALDEFLKKHKVPPSEVKHFMETVVAPWANQGMIAHLIQSDYERMNRDKDIKEGKPFENDYSQGKRDAPERKQAQAHLGNTRHTLDKMLADGNSTPKQLIDHIIENFPELEGAFDEISATNENYSFYVHAQMVLGQYLELLKADQKEKRLIKSEVIAKMILFHDMKKQNSIAMYGHGDKKDKKRKASKEEAKAGEHKLTVDLIKRYRELWDDQDQFNVAVQMMDADPFGDYMKDTIDASAAFKAIVTVARKSGIKLNDYPRFFIEYHQFYQADFSSYTSKAKFQGKDGEQGKAKKSFDTHFSENFAMKDGHFAYNERLEQKYQVLAAMFATVDSVIDHLIKLEHKPMNAQKPQQAQEGPEEGAVDDVWVAFESFFSGQ